MKVLVTGSRGTIGTQLVRELQSRGHEVFGVDLQHAPLDEGYRRADVAEHRQFARVFNRFQPDVVYHLAAEFGRMNGESWYEQAWKTNVIGTRNVLELQVEHGFRLIFASTSEVYGEEPNELMREGDVLPGAPAPRLTNDYAISKWVNEQQIMNFEARYGLECMRLRFFNAYGPGEHYTPYRSVVALFCYHALTGQPWTVYDGYHRVFMFIDDFIPTLANACERFVPLSLYNIGGDDYRSVKELSDLVVACTGCDPKLAHLLPEEKHNVVSKRPDITWARRQFDHDPRIQLEMGVPLTLSWMRDKYRV